MTRWLLLLTALLFVPPAWAGELHGVTMADEVVVGESTLHLNGMGLRKKLWIKIYVAGLYVKEKTSDPVELVKSPGPKRLVMHFLTDKATKDKMDSAWENGFQKNTPEKFKDLMERVHRFRNQFGDMKKGDIVELTIVPGEGVHAALNGEHKGTISGDDFGAALLRVWMGPHPPGGDLKKGLLGLK